MEAYLLEDLVLPQLPTQLQNDRLMALIQLPRHFSRQSFALQQHYQTRLNVGFLQCDCLSHRFRVSLQHKSLHLSIHLAQAILHQTIDDGVFYESFGADVLEHHATDFTVFCDLLIKQLSQDCQDKAISVSESATDTHTNCFGASQDEYTGCSFWFLALYFELQQSRDIFQNLLSIRSFVAVNLEVLVRIDFLYVLNVQLILLSVCRNVCCSIAHHSFIQSFLVRFEFLLTEVKQILFWHVQQNKCVWENALPLHGQSLGACFRETRKNETLLVFLYELNFFADQVIDYLIPNIIELLEARLNLLPQFKLLTFFFPQQIPDRNGSEFVVICHLQSELPHLEARRSHQEYLFCGRM